MKVLHLSPGFPPELRGGVERYVEELCPALERRGVRCAIAAGSEVFAVGKAGAVARELRGATPVVRLHRGAGDDHAIDLLHPSLAGLLDDVVAEVAPDVVHVHHWHKLGGGLVRRFFARGIPAVVTLHDAWTTCPRFNRVVDDAFCERELGPAACVPCLAPLVSRLGGDETRVRTELLARDLMVRIELACAAAVLVPSAAQRDLIARFLPGSAPAAVLPNGTSARRPLAQYRPPADGEPARVGFLGSVVVEKGVHLLLAAATEVAQHRALELHVHGNLPDAAYAERLRAADRAGILRLHGSYAPAELPALAANLHVVVLPSVCSESYSLVLEEALALGLPVIVSDRGALPERIGAAGVCVSLRVSASSERADPLAQVLRELLDDHDRLARLAAAPRAPRSMDDVARDLEPVYAAALRGPAARPDAERVLRASLFGRERPDARAPELAELDRLLELLRA